jgi:hypothetical protein
MLNDLESDQTEFTGERPASGPDRSAAYADLRRELEMIASNVGIIIETRRAQAKELATQAAAASADTARETIRGYPVTSIAAATLLGAALAVVLTPPPRPSRAAWMRQSVPEVTRAGLTDMASGLRTSTSNAVQSLASIFERVVNAVSSSDANSSLSSVAGTAGAWLKSLRTLTGANR